MCIKCLFYSSFGIHGTACVSTSPEAFRFVRVNLVCEWASNLVFVMPDQTFMEVYSVNLILNNSINLKLCFLSMVSCV